MKHGVRLAGRSCKAQLPATLHITNAYISVAHMLVTYASNQACLQACVPSCRVQHRYR
jgi:hypothetical protein